MYNEPVSTEIWIYVTITRTCQTYIMGLIPWGPVNINSKLTILIFDCACLFKSKSARKINNFSPRVSSMVNMLIAKSFELYERTKVWFHCVCLAYCWEGFDDNHHHYHHHHHHHDYQVVQTSQIPLTLSHHRACQVPKTACRVDI